MNLSSAILRGRRLGLVALVFTLAGCGDAPPSRSDAAAAISVAFSASPFKADWQGYGGVITKDTPVTQQFNVVVTDMTCQKQADRIYACAVTGLTNNQAWLQPLNVKFTNLDGKWNAELLNQ